MSVVEQFPIARSAWIVPIVPGAPLSGAFALRQLAFRNFRARTVVETHLVVFCTFDNALKVEKRTWLRAFEKLFFAFFATLNKNISYQAPGSLSQGS